VDDARDAPRLLEVGRVGRAHGLHGEVSVSFFTERPERRDPGATLVARSPTNIDRALVVASARPHQARWLIRFEGIDDRTAAESLRGCTIHAHELASDDDELWVHDLVGERVVDTSGNELGSVAAVEANPAHDLLVLDGGALVPVTFIVERSEGRVIVDVPDGLLDL
jgi:16S rRNA processing protein RimM